MTTEQFYIVDFDSKTMRAMVSIEIPFKRVATTDAMAKPIFDQAWAMLATLLNRDEEQVRQEFVITEFDADEREIEE